MLLEAGKKRVVEESESSLIRFGVGAKQEGQRAGQRLLWNGDKTAFSLSFWCGTCPLLFERTGDSTETASVSEARHHLNFGLDTIDEDVVDAFMSILPGGSYVPLLLEVQPELVTPGKQGDYFSEDQVDTWGLSQRWLFPSSIFASRRSTTERTITATGV
ncbi:hypothetical protein ACIQH5_19065 [Paenarthrobacter sp. NPDC091711]|uniref:hypothetical protein n=1 Tax=Paenarthrobacter sp. NPDC091711 TaxID=3364385 RepID=UPI00382B0AFA